MKKLILLLALLFLLISCFFLSTKNVLAQAVMRNASYIIRMGNLNSAAGKSSGTAGNLNITVGENAVGLYTGSNYTVRAGFQYISSIIPFSFSIESLFVDFGSLTPTNPVTRSEILTVSNQTAGGYIVTAFENHPLLVPANGVTIPDTTCDGGTCTESTSADWSSSLTYGFGYRCDPVTTNYCASGFTTSTYYKQFANNTTSETAQTLMSGATGRNQKSNITYKVNVSSTQPAGFYTNVITYVATPTY